MGAVVAMILVVEAATGPLVVAPPPVALAAGMVGVAAAPAPSPPLR